MANKIVDPLNINEWINLTKGVEYIPVRRNLAGNLGLFQSELLDTNTAIMPVTTSDDYKLVDIPWGTRVKNLQRDKKARLRLEVPHFAVEDAVRPLDIAGKIDFDDFLLQTRAQSVQRFLDKKKEKARQAIVNTWSDAMMGLIRDGTAYAPNQTVVNNFYTAFGVTRTELNIDLNPANNPQASIQAAIDDIIDNFKGGFVPSRFVAFTGRAFFDALKSHPFVLENARIYKEDQQSVEILTGILGTQGYNLGQRYQVLDFGGVIWIRVSSTTEMPTNEARLFPTDLPDLFKIFFAPSDLTFDTINRPAQEEYYFEKMEADRTALNFTYETNFLVATLWPKAIVKLTAVYA
jgi:hypothetical protein